VSDKRLTENEEVLEWFQKWHDDVPAHNFITRECFEDLRSMIIGLKSLVEEKLKHTPLGSLCVNRLNSDIVENVFSSQRGSCNGSNTNPTYQQFCKGSTSVLLGQSVISKKSNASSSSSVGGAIPYKLYSQTSFRPLRL